MIRANEAQWQHFLVALREARRRPRGSVSRRSFIRSLHNLNRLKGRRGVVQLHWDFARFSFCWTTDRLHGGFIYHESAGEWSVHT